MADALGVVGPTVLLRNMGSFRFEDATAAAGLPAEIHGLGLAIDDVTGNGWSDLYTSVRIDTDSGYAPLNFLNMGISGGDPTSASPDILNPYYYAVGPVADFDNDGRLDAFFPDWRTVLGPQVTSMLMKNTSPSRHWLVVRVDDELGLVAHYGNGRSPTVPTKNHRTG